MLAHQCASTLSEARIRIENLRRLGGDKKSFFQLGINTRIHEVHRLCVHGSSREATLSSGEFRPEAEGAAAPYVSTDCPSDRSKGSLLTPCIKPGSTHEHRPRSVTHTSKIGVVRVTGPGIRRQLTFVNDLLTSPRGTLELGNSCRVTPLLLQALVPAGDLPQYWLAVCSH